MTKKSFVILLLVVFFPILLAFGYFAILEKKDMNKKENMSNGDVVVFSNKEARDATIKADLISIKARWSSREIDKNVNISNFCEDVSVKKDIEEIKKQGVGVVCNSSSSGWALQTRLLSGDQNYVCIDSTSLETKTSSEKLGNSIICP